MRIKVNLGARRIVELQIPTNSRYKNRKIEETLSDSSRNLFYAEKMTCRLYFTGCHKNN